MFFHFLSKIIDLRILNQQLFFGLNIIFEIIFIDIVIPLIEAIKNL